MIRTELVNKLEIVAPALAGNDMIPVLTHFWFTGKECMAYNDQISISVPMETKFIGAVHGDTLLKLLKNSRAKDVEFVAGKQDELIIKAAQTRMQLGTMSEKDFQFDMPALGDPSLEVDAKSLIGAIENCLRSVSIDTTVPDQLGVTVMVEKTEVYFYATNNSTLSHAHLSLKKAPKWQGRAILSAPFCRQLVRLADKGKPIHLEISDEYAMYSDAKGTILFGRLVESEHPLPFHQRLEHAYPQGSAKKLIAMPTKLELMIERACVVADANVKNVATEVAVEAGKLHFFTSSPRGEVEDYATLEERHANAAIRVNPKLLKLGFADFPTFLVTDICIVMADKQRLYLIASEEKKGN